MKTTIAATDINGVLIPDPSGMIIVTVQVGTKDDTKVATIAWGGRMVGVVTKDSNNFLVSIQVVDSPNDSPALYQSLENIGNAI